MKKVAVILSGCGVYDGTEIQEAMAVLLALENHGFEAVCFAPDVDQMHVINHLKGEAMNGETRNVLVESARICRGKIHPLDIGKIKEMDALMIPGGYGAAKNLSNYAVAGTDMKVNPQVEEAIKAVHKAAKPIVSLCISPVLLARILGGESPRLTLGSDGADAKNAESMGARHEVTTHEEITVDEDLKIITAPCYMLDATVGQVFRGVDKAVARLETFLN